MMTKAAAARYWDALSDDDFERYERRQRFIDHFTDVLNHRQAAVLGAIAEQCWDRGCCSLSVDAIADEAFVSRRTVYNALRSARAWPHSRGRRAYPHRRTEVASAATGAEGEGGGWSMMISGEGPR
jgi:hypothetical protein